ncbi:hypothetical protein PW683_01340 [Streptomyces niveus]
MRLPKRPRPAENVVSDSERELFGGPLRCDTGWSDREWAPLELGLLSSVRAMPRMVAGTLRLAWRTDRPALVTVGIAEAARD